MSECETCQFFKEQSNDYNNFEGKCRKVHQYVPKMKDDWCGEYDFDIEKVINE